MEKESWDEILLEQEVRKLVTSICAVLYHHGITEIHVGGLMRVVGIDEESAAQHDDEIMVLGPEFETELEDIEQDIALDVAVPPGTTLH
jgi:hypothetical protein